MKPPQRGCDRARPISKGKRHTRVRRTKARNSYSELSCRNESNEYANFWEADWGHRRSFPRPILLADERFGPRGVIPASAFSYRSQEHTMPRAQYFVTKRNGEWQIRAGYRYSGPYSSKAEALQVAIDFAERDGQAGREAQVLVQGADRLFQPAWTYGRDPYPMEPRGNADRAPIAGNDAKSA